MNQCSYLLPEGKPLPGGNSLHGLFMGRVLSVDPATYTADVWIEDGSTVHKLTVAALRAHNARGWTWLPEEGELVVVAFLGGAKVRGVILGSMYDTQDALPDSDPNTMTLYHQSGSHVHITATGDIRITHANTGDIVLDSDSIVVNQRGAGQLELRHQNNQEVALSGTQVLLQSANGQTTLTIDDTKATMESNGSRIEVDNAGAINIFPAATAVLNLGSGGTSFAIRDTDITSPPIGVDVPDHYHTLIAGGTKVIIGG